MRVFHNLKTLRSFYLDKPERFDVGHRVPNKDGLFILNPSLMEDESDWLKALRIIAVLNQDGLCPCLEPLHRFDLHHALISKGDVQGCRTDVKALIHHTYNVIAMHRECHEAMSRIASAAYLRVLYEEDVEIWYKGFPLSSKRNYFEGRLNVTVS